MLRFLIFLIPIFLYADSLKSILEFASINSDLVVSKTYSKESKKIQVDARKSAYYPTLDVGAFYQSLNQKSPFQAGDTYSAYAKLSFDIYDGGSKSNLLSQSEKEHIASEFDLESTKKSLSLKITENFFNIKSLEASMASRDEAKKSLQEQLTRMKRFFTAKLATSDDVDRLQAAYDTNIYEMESIRLDILTIHKRLELFVGKKIYSLEDSSFKEYVKSDMQLIDSVKSLMALQDALVYGAESIDSVYYPNIKIEDTYNAYGYNRTDNLHPKGLDNQNKLMLSLNMRLFDMGVVSKSKEAVIINSQVINTQVAYANKEQLMQYNLAVVRIDISNVKIKSATSALKSATSAFKTISKKYDAGIVDNIVYLDALSSQTNAKALYEKSINDLEVAYATYYYYAGKNIEEFIK
ncbi:TolC family protein [Sulfurimonas sp.]|uniref:TolC family protein n=1 Tax=Sulfurimonas sp. TaxID=2022749 RepID=UPI002B491EA5|nr:TolC family protein [Sulfurimonas sp.]